MPVMCGICGDAVAFNNLWDCESCDQLVCVDCIEATEEGQLCTECFEILTVMETENGSQ